MHNTIEDRIVALQSGSVDPNPRLRQYQQNDDQIEAAKTTFSNRISLLDPGNNSFQEDYNSEVLLYLNHVKYMLGE